MQWQHLFDASKFITNDKHNWQLNFLYIYTQATTLNYFISDKLKVCH